MAYLIDFFDHVTVDTINEYFVANNISVIKTFDKLGKVYHVDAESMPERTDIVEWLINDQATPIEPLAIEYKTFPVNDDDEHWWKLATVNIKDYNVAEIKHPLNPDVVDVYLVDGGIKADHPEFNGVNIRNLYSYDSTWADLSGHGTALASLISGNRCSLTKANIVNVKVFGSTTTYQSHMVAAIDAILADREGKIRPAVVNMSWSIPKNDYIESKIQALINKNILVICSAGNNGQPIANVTPASMPDPVTVGAYNKEFYPCDFSNYTGPSAIQNAAQATNWGSIDVWAPGEMILAAMLDGGYQYIAGTSVAAAIESAVIAYAFGEFYNSDDPPADWKTYETLRAFHMDTLASKMGMLVLEGNYAECVNRTAVMISQVNNEATYESRFQPIVVRAKSGEPFLQKAFHLKYTDRFETIGQFIPQGVTIDNGWIKGTVWIEPDKDYEIFNYELKHYNDELGFTAIQNVQIIVAQPTLDLSTYPEDHPDLPLLVTLEWGPGCGGSPTYGTGWGICGGGCSGGQICGDWWWACAYAVGSGKTYSCQCAISCP